MPLFYFEGIDKKTGKTVKGTKEAVSQKGLIQTLLKSGIYVSSTKEVSQKKFIFKKLFDFQVKKYIPDFYFQLSLLVRSGIPLVNSLKIIVKSTGNSRLREIITDIYNNVEQGNKFSDSLDKYSNVFESIHINLIKVAESTGKLPETLMDIFEYESEKKASIDKIKSAIVYPMTILILGFGVLGFLLSFVVPKMEKIFSSMNKELPLSTKVLISIGNFLRFHGYIVFIVLACMFVVFKVLYSYNKKFRTVIDRFLLGIGFIKDITISKLAHNLSFQLNEGLTLVSSLKATSNTLNNIILKEHLNRISEEVSTGKKFSDSVKKADIFPELFVAAVATGEKSGNLAEFLNRISEFYSKQFEKVTSRFISLIEPVFIVFIGLIVGFIVTSIMGPLFEINTFIK